MTARAAAQACAWLLLASTAAGDERDPLEAECSRMHQAFRVEHGENAAELRDAWRTARQKCGGTGYYEYLLAADERRAGDAAAAISILEDMIRRKLPYQERGVVTLNSIRADQAMHGNPPDRARLRTLRDELIAFSGQHPDLAYAHQQIAQESISLEDFGVAVEHARKAIELDAASAGARGYLVFALHELNRCAQAVPEIRPALDADRTLLRNTDFMLTAVDCYTETGDATTGEAALRGLLRNRPEVKDDPRVLQLQQYFAERKAGGPPAR